MGLVNVKSRHFDVIQTLASNPVALTSDVAKGLFFWADNIGNIYKSDGQRSSTLYSGALQYFLYQTEIHICPLVLFHRSNRRLLPCLCSTGEPGITGLACDWLSGNLFWVNQRTESIDMMAADGSNAVTVLGKNISPSEIVLLPVERCVLSSVPLGFDIFFILFIFNDAVLLVAPPCQD